MRARRSGYFKALNVTAAHDVLDEHDARMTVQVHYGFFVMPGHPLMRIDRELDDDCTNRLLDCFDFYVEEYAHRHFFFGFKQIVEIAVRALSPGINDPGTAIKAIDMLSVLLAERMEMPDHEVAHAQDRPRIFIRELNLHQLLQMTFGPQRRYGADDLQVLQALLQACKNLLYAAKDADTERVLLRHAQAVVDQAAISLSGALDRQAMVEAVRSLNQAVRHAEPLQCATLRES